MPRVIFLLFALSGLAGVFILSSLSTSVSTLAAPPSSSENLLVCSDELNMQIPDQNSVGINIPIQVSDTRTIEDLDVIIDLDHDFVGDLEIYLSNGITRSTILRRPNNGEGACRGDDLTDVVANDQVSPSFNQNCNDQGGGAQAYEANGNYRPGDPANGNVLMIYNDTSTFGEWTLNVKDVANVNGTGTFQNWCLSFTVPVATPTAIPPTPINVHAPLVMKDNSATTPTPTPTPTPTVPPTCLTVEDETRYPNNTTQQAADNIPLCVAQLFRGKHNLANDREDIYLLNIATGGSYAINLRVADIDLSLLLYDFDRNLIGDSVTPGLDNERITQNLEAGSYFVRVYRAGDNISEQEYELLTSPN